MNTGWHGFDTLIYFHANSYRFLKNGALDGAQWSTIHGIMGINNDKDILNILYILVPYYVCYNIAAMIDAWFVSKGKTIYLFLNSVVVNIVYYGIMYALFKTGAFRLNIYFIIHLFGLGMVDHMLISILLLWRLKINVPSVH